MTWVQLRVVTGNQTLIGLDCARVQYQGGAVRLRGRVHFDTVRQRHSHASLVWPWRCEIIEIIFSYATAWIYLNP